MLSDNHPQRLEVSAELRLLAACCDRPKTASSKAQVQERLQTIKDWTAFHSEAVRHHVEGFAYDRLKDCRDVPADIRQEWRGIESGRVLRNLLQSHMTSKLHALLNENGVLNIVLKGLPLSEQLYRSQAIRRSGDIDLLIAPENAWKSVQILAKEGFRLVENGTNLTQRQTRCVVRHFKEITLQNDSNVAVDLHWKMVDFPDAFSNFDPLSNMRKTGFGNAGEIAVLGEAEQFAYLCVHGALTDWSRLKWLADINALIGDSSERVIIDWYARAKELGCGPSVLQALGLRDILWGKPPPAELSRTIEEIDEPEFLAFPIERMLTPYRSASSRDAVARIRRQTHVRSVLYGGSAQAIRGTIAHMRALPDVLALPLPKTLDWLYYPLRPVLWAIRKVRS
ncbi:nucleotidyltransferase family protein [Erythrobacter sp. F6033]|uniref:nucleotidyltransferase domain-containing protein n=1 Tax=Erythrobacter sp. F6033 TaxID=2926401 RepID=UPI001FF3D7F3|nr:nucleotidyltransferase family protein [Erythrobacter sp. F6033]MCK0127769.1 nucleotidyltransferase family protein [Erythrobacter sp. F6033]